MTSVDADSVSAGARHPYDYFYEAGMELRPAPPGVQASPLWTHTRKMQLSEWLEVQIPPKQTPIVRLAVDHLWQGDQRMDALLGRWREIGAGRGRADFERALVDGIDSVSDPVPELVALFDEVDTIPPWFDFDSTLAAARYLCSGGLNLRDPQQVHTAILRYNNSMAYAHNVLGWAAAYGSGVVPLDLPPLTGPPPPLGDAHLDNPEGIGPGLPLNVHGLPTTDPLVRTPLIDFDPVDTRADHAMPPGPSDTQSALNCTVICIGS